MDKEEFRAKLEEINVLVANRDYKAAMNVVDTVDWRRVKNVRTLCTVGEIYAANKRYEDSKDIFLLAYHRAPIGKTILYRLIEVSLKMGDVKEAIEYFEEYKAVAPNDNARYVLKYKILKLKRNSLNEQITALEEYKNREFTEKWAYELAKLYYKAGDKQKCAALCDEIILWFNEGTYVVKSLDLKMRMGMLTGKEKERYEQQFVPKLVTPEQLSKVKDKNTFEESEIPSLEPEKPHIESIQIRGEKDLRGSETLQDKISKGLRDILGGMRKTGESLFEEEKDQEDDYSDGMLRKKSERKQIEDEEYENVPDLEEDEDVPVQKAEKIQSMNREQLEGTIRMPELKIPDSMKNMGLKETLRVPDTSAPVRIYDKQEKEEIEEAKPAKADDFEFNLEATILAAATAQGIIPAETVKEPEEEIKDVLKDESKVEADEEIQVETMKSATVEEPEEIEASEEISKEESIVESVEEVVKEESSKAEIKDLEEEILTEEDLKEAEEEFLYGPKDKKKIEKTVVPDLEFEDVIGKPLSGEALFSGNSEVNEDGIPYELLKRIMEDEEETETSIKSLKEPEFKEEVEPEETEMDTEEELTEEERLEKFIESLQPEEEKNPFEIILREKKLTEEEKKLFTYFVTVPSVKEQILEVLCEAQEAAVNNTSKTGNIIVMGGKETGKTRLIASLIPAICKELNMEAAKVAYVFAEQINGKDIDEIVKKMAGGFLVIENVNQLNPETAEELDRALENNTEGLTVIIEDEKIGMRKMLARYPKLAKKFTSMINIPVFTNDELVNFAKVYTKENGYKIEQMGLLALYNLIGVNQKEDEPMNVGRVKELVDSAIGKSQGGIRKFKKKRVDRDGFTLLFEKDFSNK